MCSYQNSAILKGHVWKICLIVHSILLLNVETSNNISTVENEKDDTCDMLYKNGVDAYLEERWTDCINFLQRAVLTHNNYIKNLVGCRMKCKGEVRDSDSILDDIDIESLQFYDNIIRNTLCQIKCKKGNKYLSNGYEISKDTETLFELRKPYEYLHICYFQDNKMQDAASAAFTYLSNNPDEIMLKNLNHYAKFPEVNMNEVLNFEAKDYVYLYIHGSNMYDHKNWKSVINYMEESLTAYLQAEEECRAQCEGPFDQGWHPDFISSIANHFAYCLKCKRRCPHKLNKFNGRQHDDLIPRHFHYLQFAYFKVGNLNMACEAVASYLLFYPNDEVMLSNKEYYSKLPKIEKAHFTPRQEIVEYIKRQNNELKLLHYINTEFIFDEKLDENDFSKDI